MLAGNEEVAAELVGGAQGRGPAVDSSFRRRSRPTSAACSTYDSIVVVDVPRLRFTDKQLGRCRRTSATSDAAW